MVSGHEGSNPTSPTPPIYFEPRFCDLKSTYFSKIPTHPPQLIKNTSLGPVFRRNTSLTPPNAMRMDH